MAARLSRARVRVRGTAPTGATGWPLESGDRAFARVRAAAAIASRGGLVALAVSAVLALGGCQAPSRELSELVVRDSTYLDSETMLPFSGRVFRNFAGEDGGPQLEAAMRDGTWQGELTVYHESGRIRYQGEMSGGARCGAWVENDNPAEPESVYEAIKEDLESLVMYPECPEG